MAFVTTETSTIQLAGFTPAMLMISGTYTSSSSGTGGVIAPGYTNSSTTFTASTLPYSVGGRKIIGAPIICPTTEDVTTPKAIVSYNATLDRQIVTITTVADATGTYTLFCQDNGA